jgi:cbb3-type cytochrome oxidase maturation protein
MEIIVLLISISVFIALAFLAVFYWSYKSGQYDDTHTPSIRMLFDDDTKRVNPKTKPSKKQKSN